MHKHTRTYAHAHAHHLLNGALSAGHGVGGKELLHFNSASLAGIVGGDGKQTRQQEAALVLLAQLGPAEKKKQSI